MMAFDDDREDDKEVPEGALEEVLDEGEEEDTPAGEEPEEKGWE